MSTPATNQAPFPACGDGEMTTKPPVAAADRWTTSFYKTIGPDGSLRGPVKHHWIGAEAAGRSSELELVWEPWVCAG